MNKPLLSKPILPVIPKKPIHLLYVPTIFCNMSCQYCYLGDLTDQPIEADKAISTLQYALKQMLSHHYLPFNLSFHGGEVLTLPGKVLSGLLDVAVDYYDEYGDEIKAAGFQRSPLHIKTNLLNFSKHYKLLDKYKVSISASIDLPLALHEKYRLDKRLQSTLGRTVSNLRALADYPHKKKISCVVTREHLQDIDAFIADIHYLHKDVGLNMNRFNIMFSFDSLKNDEKQGARESGVTMLSHDEQVKFYYTIKEAFINTELAEGFREHWFHEFTPDYCCSAVNCGDKFFLLQHDGKVYSCPRGQSSEHYYYGNIFADEIDKLMNNGWKVIEHNENQLTIDKDCISCSYIQHCHSGCTFVRQETGLQKSYTCHLQKALYKDSPDKYPPLPPQQVEDYVKRVLFRNNVKQIKQVFPKKQSNVTPELVQEENSLAQIIQRDDVLTQLYSDRLFYLKVDDLRYDLQSPILKNTHDIEYISTHSEVILGVHKEALSINSQDDVNNHILIMLLRNTPVVYGDEGRSKQEHIFDYSIYHNALTASSNLVGDYYEFDLSTVVKMHAPHYQRSVKNNLFITTKTLREYHYSKHKKNAFYHIQAINLPFPNIEFLWNFEE